jgi:hypothetical protein
MSTPRIETIHIIPLEGKVNIEVSGYFYREAMTSYFNVVNLIGDEKVEVLSKALTDNTVHLLPEEDQTHAVTIHMHLALLKTVEEAFKTAKTIITEDIEIPTEDSKS